MEMLKELCLACSPSGSEARALDVWRKHCARLNGARESYNDKMGDCAFEIGHGPVKVMLSGHIDEIHARVTSISDDGMCTIASGGGIDPRSLVAAEVVVMGDKGDLRGFVGKKPLHYEHGEEVEVEMDKLMLDVGARSKAEAEGLGVRVGTIAVYARNWAEIGVDGDTVVSVGLDDKCGVWCAYEIMRRLTLWGDQSWADKYTVTGVAMAQEETGLRGAVLAARAIDPDISVDFDVTFCSDGGVGMSVAEVGDVKLGKGAVIQYGADKSERLNAIFREMTQFPHQATAGGAGGTNTKAIQESARDCETTIIGLPNRSMHSPVEMVSKSDLESAVNTVVTAIIEHKL